MNEIVDVTRGLINLQNIGGIRDGEGDCGHIDSPEPVTENESPE